MNNTSSESEIGVQPDNRKSKAVEPLRSLTCTKVRQRPAKRPVSLLLFDIPSSTGIQGVHRHCVILSFTKHNEGFAGHSNCHQSHWHCVQQIQWPSLRTLSYLLLHVLE